MAVLAEIFFAAWMSIVALAIVVIISCLNEDLNVGFLSVAFAIVVGGVWVDLNAAKVMNAFPPGPFMILVGVTFLFALASTNGTMEKLAAYALRACGGQTAWVPLITYLLVTVLTTSAREISPPRRWLPQSPWPSPRASASRPARCSSAFSAGKPIVGAPIFGIHSEIKKKPPRRIPRRGRA